MLFVEAALGVAQALAAALAIAGQLVAALVAELLVLGCVDLGGLLEDLLRQLLVGAVLPLGGVGGDPGAVEGERADRDQAGLAAEDQYLGEELGQLVGVACAKAGDRRVVGHLVGGDHPEGDVLGAAALDPPRGALADRVGVEQQRDHHLGVVGCSTQPSCR